MGFRVRLWISAALAAALFLAAPASAQGPADRVRTMLGEVMAAQKGSAGAGGEGRARRTETIREIIGRNFDFRSMAKSALGREWEKRNPGERAEFQALFQGLFLDSYTKLVLDFLKQEQIVYGEEEVRPETASVKTTLVRANEQIPVDYTLNRSQGRWLVEDVSIDGVSILGNYRQAFTRVIQRESFESLLQKMRLQQRAVEKPS